MKNIAFQDDFNDTFTHFVVVHTTYFEFYKQENHDLFTVKSLYFIFYSEKCCDKENELKMGPSDLIMCACT